MAEKNLAGYCGLYCGLCTKFQSKTKSRCPGCRVAESSPYCSIWRCATKKRSVESCAFCESLRECEIFARRDVMRWPSVADNLQLVKREGLDSWIAGQERRRELVERLIAGYNDGRSMTFFCKAASRMPVEAVEASVEEIEGAIDSVEVDRSDVKHKAKALRAIILEKADNLKISLK